MHVVSGEQVRELKAKILLNAEKSKAELARCLQYMNAVQLFGAIKFERMGVDPVSGEQINLIEQINQMYSDLVVIAAVQKLLDQYPGKVFELQLGPSAGYDIHSQDGQVIAECFAVTNVGSNDKLNKDCQKLLQSDAEHKYLFFYTHHDCDSLLQNRYGKYPEIQFVRINQFEI